MLVTAALNNLQQYEYYFRVTLYGRLISYGLRVSQDYEALQEGENLTCQIQGAIRTTSLHVAIPPNICRIVLVFK